MFRLTITQTEIDGTSSWPSILLHASTALVPLVLSTVLYSIYSYPVIVCIGYFTKRKTCLSFAVMTSALALFYWATKNWLKDVDGSLGELIFVLFPSSDPSQEQETHSAVSQNLPLGVSLGFTLINVLSILAVWSTIIKWSPKGAIKAPQLKRRLLLFPFPLFVGTYIVSAVDAHGSVHYYSTSSVQRLGPFINFCEALQSVWCVVTLLVTAGCATSILLKKHRGMLCSNTKKLERFIARSAALHVLAWVKAAWVLTRGAASGSAVAADAGTVMAIPFTSWFVFIPASFVRTVFFLCELWWLFFVCGNTGRCALATATFAYTLEYESATPEKVGSDQQGTERDGKIELAV